MYFKQKRTHKTQLLFLYYNLHQKMNKSKQNRKKLQQQQLTKSSTFTHCIESSVRDNSKHEFGRHELSGFVLFFTHLYISSFHTFSSLSNVCFVMGCGFHSTFFIVLFATHFNETYEMFTTESKHCIETTETILSI